MMTVGTQLKRARLARSLAYADVARETKIQPWVLEALENDTLASRMSLIYVKGFLTSYAKFLHLDAEPLMGQLAPATPEAPASLKDELPPPAPAPDFPIAIRIPWPLLRRVGLAAAGVAGVALVLSVHPLQRLSQVKWPALHLPKMAKAASDKKIAKAPKAAKAPTPAPAQKAPQPSAPAASEQAAKAAPSPAIAAASIAPMMDPLKPTAPPPLTIVATQPLELTIKASRTTWVRVRADGKLLTQQRLNRGAKERWVAKRQFEIVVAHPSQVELALNGQPITSYAVAHQGRMLITHQGVATLPEAP